MAYTFKPQALFTKGIIHAEFYDPANDQLLGFSPYVTDFGLNGSFNNGDVEGGIGNQLIISIPDTSRLEVTATTADSALNNHALTVGAALAGNGIIEAMASVTASGTSIAISSNACAPYGGQNGAIAYVLTSSGSDKAAVEAASGTPYSVTGAGVLSGFTAVNGNTYCVKYFIKNSSADELTIPANFQPKVVRAHFAVNVYSQKGNGDVMSGSLVKIRHYYFPYYQFNQPLQMTESQTTPGSTNLGGRCLSYQDALEAGLCASENSAAYGFIVDEIVGSNTSTAKVQGIYIVGGAISVAASDSVAVPVKYDVNGFLTDISDLSQVTFTTPADTTAKWANSHSNTIQGVAAGSTTATVSVTNSVTGVTYTDTVPVTVTA